MAVITVSRLPASLGDSVGKAIAERLAYRLIDRDELARLATHVGGPESWDTSPELRERSPTFWERLNEERRRYQSVLRSVVLRLAEEDDVVIVGLGAGQLLRDLHNVLRLQVVAPLPLRIQRLMEHGDEDIGPGLSRDQARERIRQRDREAAGYMRYLFNIDWLEATHWDLVINTARFTAAEAADMVAWLVESGQVVARPADTQRLANLALAGFVEAALLNQANVWVNGLRVSAEDGRVRIEGEVIAEEDREIAEQVVRAINGVRMVENDLRIQPPPLTGM